MVSKALIPSSKGKRESRRWRNKKLSKKRTSTRSHSQKRLKSSPLGPNNRRKKKIPKSFLSLLIWRRLLPLSSLTCSELNNETHSRLSNGRQKLTARFHTK